MATDRKHSRAIALTPWQRQAIDARPGAFLAGLIHSDGCRVINRVKGHEYPRYFFSNKSPAIRALFADVCGAVGRRLQASRPAECVGGAKGKRHGP
jgi:hypothetical protein